MQIALGMFLGIALLLMLQRLLRGYVILSAPIRGTAKTRWTSRTVGASGPQMPITVTKTSASSNYGQVTQAPEATTELISSTPLLTSPSPSKSKASQATGENGAVSQVNMRADVQGFIDATNRVSELLTAIAAPKQQSIARRALHFLNPVK